VIKQKAILDLIKQWDVSIYFAYFLDRFRFPIVRPTAHASYLTAQNRLSRADLCQPPPPLFVQLPAAALSDYNLPGAPASVANSVS
jgi:hypothetical protein